MVCSGNIEIHVIGLNQLIVLYRLAFSVREYCLANSSVIISPSPENGFCQSRDLVLRTFDPKALLRCTVETGEVYSW